MHFDVHQHYADGTTYAGYDDFPAELIAAMDSNGCDWTALNALGPKMHNGTDDDVLAAVERYPDRILGLGFLDPDRMAPDEVDEFKRKGMRGLKVIGTLRPYDCDDYLPHYERAAALGLPILFHTGFLGGDPSEEVQDVASDRYRPMTLDRIARLFPDLPLIAAHMGTVIWFQEAIAVMSHPNVYGDTSGGPSDMPAAFLQTYPNDRLQWEKVVFGSDSLPRDAHIPFNNLKALMGELGLEESVQAGVLGGTAARIFGVE
ncbi:MAG: amidohydrolase family protein [Planctomycetota bacterium]|jgi:predicted TIM-barrel fold metal-dependent hydrolase